MRLIVTFIAFWGGAESAEPLRILAMGDSILAWHKWLDRNVSSEMGDVLGAQTDNATVSSAHFSNRTEGRVQQDRGAGALMWKPSTKPAHST